MHDEQVSFDVELQNIRTFAPFTLSGQSVITHAARM
jgi:hypothetical protein